MVWNRSQSAFDIQIDKFVLPLNSASFTQNQVVKINESVSNPYVHYYDSAHPKLGTFSVAFYKFTLDKNAPRFMHGPDGRSHKPKRLDIPLRSGFMKVFDLSADLSGMSGGLERRRGRQGAYWVLNFSVAIEFGGVELQAYIEWVEKVGKALFIEILISNTLDHI